VREALDQTVMPADAFKLFDRIEWGVLAPGATVTTMLHTRAPKKRKPPRLMVIYGPSAVGRGGVLRKLFADYPAKFEMVVSHTTRPPRAHEVDGEHYHFRTKEEVERMQAEGLMLELQTVNGYLCGTSLPAVQKVVAGGRFPVVSIDAQGVKAMQAQTGKYKIDTLYVHVVPPSMEVLQQRMEGRLKEHEITINKRIAFAQSEVRSRPKPWVLASPSLYVLVCRAKALRSERRSHTLLSCGRHSLTQRRVVVLRAWCIRWTRRRRSRISSRTSSITLRMTAGRTWRKCTTTSRWPSRCCRL